MRVPLNTGSYEARSVIASAQRSMNLYSERNPDDAEVKLTHYNCPGTRPLGTAPNAPGRGLYWANSGTLFYCAGNTLYTVSPTWTLTSIGTIGTNAGIVSMADNGTTMVLVDGSPNGYQVTLATNTFSAISQTANQPPQDPTDPGDSPVYGFYGADRVDMIDGFMLMNQPGTRNFYTTYTNEIIFDATYFAAKNGYSDNLVSVIVSLREIWLIGERTTEIWYDAGNATFPFSIMPGPFIQHGCSAKWTVAQVDGAIFFLSQDQAGQNILARAQGYAAKQISTHALEQEWATYPTVSDAYGFCFQFGGHSFYQITFPSAGANGKTWRWDETTGLWHEPVYTDANGNECQHRAACAAFAYGTNVVADYQTGQLYALDPDCYTDNGMPMQFRRGYPHMMADGKRQIYPGFTLDVEAATAPATPPGPEPIVNLRWSDTRGRTWGQPVPQTLGRTGQYLAQPKWNRLGSARDRAFEVYGTVPGKLAINGAFLDKPIPMAN